jgi:hypothetical protein
VAHELISGGARAVAANFNALGVAPTYEEEATEVAALTKGPGWTLVVHSAAGGHAPSILAVMDQPTGVIFVDAILPHPGQSWMDTAPPDLVARLKAQAVDGILPAWNEWFGADVMKALLPDARQRKAFIAELPRIPLDWLEVPAPVIDDWTPPLCAYIQLSAAYDAEAATVEEAAPQGWLLRRLDLTHLAMLTHPDRVATELASLTPE